MMHFVNIIFKHHGLPHQIISDHDHRFTGNFWKALMKSLDIQQGMRTAFHPQTNSQMERMNCVIKQILWIYMDY